MEGGVPRDYAARGGTWVPQGTPVDGADGAAGEPQSDGAVQRAGEWRKDARIKGRKGNER